MTAIFNYDKVEKVNLNPGKWVRIMGGHYEGDLALVIYAEDPIINIHIQLVPLTDFNHDKVRKGEPKSRAMGQNYG